LKVYKVFGKKANKKRERKENDPEKAGSMMRIIPPWEFNEEDYLRKKVEQIKRRAAMGLPIAWKRPLSELNPKTLKEFMLKLGMTPYQHYLRYGRFEDIPGYGIPRRYKPVKTIPTTAPAFSVEKQGIGAKTFSVLKKLFQPATAYAAEIPRKPAPATPRPVSEKPEEKVEIPYLGKFTKEQLVKAGMIAGGIILLSKLLK